MADTDTIQQRTEKMDTEQEPAPSSETGEEPQTQSLTSGKDFGFLPIPKRLR